MEGPVFKSRTVSSGKQASGKFGMVLVFLQVLMWGSRIGFEYLCPTVSLPNSLSLHTHPCRKIVWDMHWNAGDAAWWDIIAGSCTQEPKFRSEIATSSQPPYFLWKRLAFYPCTCCTHVKLHQDRPHSSSGSILSPCCCSGHPFYFASNHLISNNCSPRSCWGPFFLL